MMDNPYKQMRSIFFESCLKARNIREQVNNNNECNNNSKNNNDDDNNNNNNINNNSNNTIIITAINIEVTAAEGAIDIV